MTGETQLTANNKHNLYLSYDAIFFYCVSINKSVMLDLGKSLRGSVHRITMHSRR